MLATSRVMNWPTSVHRARWSPSSWSSSLSSSPSSPDLYSVLHLSPTSTRTEVREAFFKQAKKYHPDVDPSDEAKRRFALAQKAYQVLSNDRRRADYDRTHHPSATAVMEERRQLHEIQWTTRLKMNAAYASDDRRRGPWSEEQAKLVLKSADLRPLKSRRRSLVPDTPMDRAALSEWGRAAYLSIKTGHVPCHKLGAWRLQWPEEPLPLNLGTIPAPDVFRAKMWGVVFITMSMVTLFYLSLPNRENSALNLD